MLPNDVWKYKKAELLEMCKELDEEMEALADENQALEDENHAMTDEIFENTATINAAYKWCYEAYMAIYAGRNLGLSIINDKSLELPEKVQEDLYTFSMLVKQFSDSIPEGVLRFFKQKQAELDEAMEETKH